MASVEQKNLILILARELAANLATPVFVFDPAGTLVYFNEAGSALVGQSFGEAGELAPSDWQDRLGPQPMLAIVEGRPTQEGGITAVPLFATGDELIGAVAFVWDR